MAPGPPGAASPGIAAGRFLFLSAQLPAGPHGTKAGGTATVQADRALRNLAQQLRSAGLSLDDVVSLEIHLVDPADQAAIDMALETWFAPPYPALTLAGVPWLPGGARLQVAAIAQRY
jgi:2-iminobutanoate/2-iminopropanoate deaminase